MYITSKFNPVTILLLLISVLIISVLSFANGFLIGKSLPDRLIISKGVTDEQIANKVIYQALDGYISISNRYIGQLNINGLRLYHALDEPYNLSLRPEIRIGMYPGDEAFKKVLTTNEDIHSEVIEDKILENGIRYVFVRRTVKPEDTFVHENAYYIKAGKLLHIHGQDIKKFSEKIMESYACLSLFYPKDSKAKDESTLRLALGCSAP